jgi:hypothetical protein
MSIRLVSSEPRHSSKNTLSNAPAAGFDRYAGGRYLTAIRYIRDLAGPSKSVLAVIGSLINFNDFSAEWFVTIEKLAEYSGFGTTTVKAAVADLIERGYITRRKQRWHGRNGANAYRLTDRVFANFEEAHGAHVERPEPALAPETASQRSGDDRWTASQKPSADQSQRSGDDRNQRSPDGRKLLKEARKENFPIITPEEEAKIIGETLYVPTEERRQRGAFVRLGPVHAVMEAALKRYGIEALRWLRDKALEQRMCGEVSWSPRRLFESLDSFQAAGMTMCAQ